MVTLADIYRDAHELQPHNPGSTGVKLALWAALLSAQSSLENNIRQYERIRDCTTLPSQQELFRLMKGTQNFFGGKARGLYWIEALERDGKLDDLASIGTSYQEQCQWRRRVYGLVHGHGMSWKTISFAAALLDPEHCQLVPVDRHVLKRLGYETDCSPKSYQQYQSIEQRIIDERDTAGYEHIPLFLWHWLKWEQWRQQQGKSVAAVGCQSHVGLSVQGTRQAVLA